MAIDTTSERIASAALTLFLAQGVKKTTLDEVAYQAGVTRVTVYRYFGDKNGLVRAVCARIAAIFQQSADGSPEDSMSQVEARLSRLGMELSALPQGNMLARLDEINRLYPEVYREFRAARQAAVDALFQQALAAATREASIREGLNDEVLKAVFLSSVVGLLEAPALISSNVPLAELFATVTEVFRHGILKSPAGRTHDGE